MVWDITVALFRASLNGMRGTVSESIMGSSLMMVMIMMMMMMIEVRF